MSQTSCTRIVKVFIVVGFQRSVTKAVSFIGKLQGRVPQRVASISATTETGDPMAVCSMQLFVVFTFVLKVTRWKAKAQ